MSEKTCPECGGNCAPECGRHPKGCIYGGPAYEPYWLIAVDCKLEHRCEPEPDELQVWASGWDAYVEAMTKKLEAHAAHTLLKEMGIKHDSS